PDHPVHGRRPGSDPRRRLARVVHAPVRHPAVRVRGRAGRPPPSVHLRHPYRYLSRRRRRRATLKGANRRAYRSHHNPGGRRRNGQSRQVDRPRGRRRSRRRGRWRRHWAHLRQGNRGDHPPARDARRDHPAAVAGLRADRGHLLLRARGGPAGRLHRLAMLTPLANGIASLGSPGTHVLAANGSFLIKPSVGLMVWTLLVFGATMVLLGRLAFPRISQALERRQRMIEDSIETAERTRVEAEKLLTEYRERLREARAQADEIIQRARQVAEAREHEAKERGHELVTEAAQRAQRDIEAATKRALDDLRKEVVELTILATEKVTRKALDDSDQKRLVEEALAELDLSGLSAGAARN